MEESVPTSDLKQRVLTAVVMISVIISLVIVGGAPLKLLAFAVVAAVSFEFSNIISRGVSRVFTFAVGIAPTVGALFLLGDPNVLGVAVSSALLIIVIIARFRGLSREHLDQAALALFVPGVLGASLYSLSALDRAPLLWFLFLVASSDIGAYFGGRYFGGMKLAAEISPKKTVSGAVSGLLAAAIFSVIYLILFPFNLGATEPLALSSGVILGVALAAVSQLGDLSGSLIKRIHNVKDSGGLLPGHGGVFDRVVAHLVSAPFFLTALS